MNNQTQHRNWFLEIGSRAAGVALVLAVLLVLAVVATQSAQAQSYTLQPVYSFTGVNTVHPTLSDGASPYGGVVVDALGNLYGATEIGGEYKYGTVFKLSPVPVGGCPTGSKQTAGDSWCETVLYSFTNNSTTFTDPLGNIETCYDGAFPLGGLVLDNSGNLFGTTSQGGGSVIGGPTKLGTVFEVTPNSTPPVLNDNSEACISSNGASTPPMYEVPLYSFGGGADGGTPEGTLVLDKKGNMFGTNSDTVFEVSPEGQLTMYYNFSANGCDSAGNCPNGANPGADLALVGQSLYGTTLNGGANGLGTVFQLSPPNFSYETGIIQFGNGDYYGNTDGAQPFSGLKGSGGKSMSSFYGTTNGGGANDSGTVYETDNLGDETVLYSFCALPDCADGAYPVGGVVRDKRGNFYGTTTAGGAYGLGTVFMVSPVSVANDEYNETVLYNFTGGSDGAVPTADLVMDAQGNLYGTANSGGVKTGTYCSKIYGCGTVFEMVLNPLGVPTTTTLVSSPSSSTYGQQVTLTATVAAVGSSSIPKGSVTFTENGTKLKTVFLQGGVAPPYTTPKLVAGTDSIIATYTPSGSFVGSTSSTVYQPVSQASTTTTLVSSANGQSEPYKTSITFTATVVNTQYPGGGTISGTVTFYDGATALKTVNVGASGVANYKTSAAKATALASGTHNITAVYSGTLLNGNLAGSTSNLVAQVVD